MARFQLNSGRVKGFICRKHMAAQNPIRQMLELLKAGRGNIRFKEGLSSKLWNRTIHRSDRVSLEAQLRLCSREPKPFSISCLLPTINVAQKKLISLSKGFTLRINCTF